MPIMDDDEKTRWFVGVKLPPDAKGSVCLSFDGEKVRVFIDEVERPDVEVLHMRKETL